MGVETVLAAGRAAFLRRMRATVKIERPGEPVTGPDARVTTPRATLYEGPGYTRYPGLAFEQNPEVAGATLTLSRILVRVPHGIQYRPNDVVTIVADPDNPQMAGTELQVQSSDDQSQATAQRLLCSDPQSGAL